jgi:uncharacterized protein (DUF58 family)
VTAPGRARRGWIVPESRLAVLLAIVAPLWLLSSNRLGLVAAIAATVAIGAAIVSELVRLPPARSVEVSRDAPARSGLGDDVHMGYRIVSPWPRDTAIAIHESVPAALRTVASPPLRTIMHEGQAFAESAIRPSLRGVHAVGSVSLRLSGPNRLLARSVRIPMDDEISVAPSLAPVRRFRLRALQARTGEAGSRVLRQRGESLTFSGLRGYVPGDDPRRIDWKATARQRVPITREYNLEQGQTILIAIDAGRLMTQTEAGVSRFEQALSSALVLATVAADAGDKVGLLLFDDAIRAFIPPRGGIQAVRLIRDALVFVEPRLVEPDYAAAFATMAARQRRRALVVLFSDVIDARSSRAIIAHTTRSASRHLHVVVAMRSESLFRAGVPSAEPSADSLFVNAAAEELVLAREEALQRMRGSGVTVVDVPANAVSASVVDRYLEIKARGSL